MPMKYNRQVNNDGILLTDDQQSMLEFACEHSPQDGYESDFDNDTSSLFSTIIQMIDLYDRMHNPHDHDKVHVRQGTLQAIAENRDVADSGDLFTVGVRSLPPHTSHYLSSSMDDGHPTD